MKKIIVLEDRLAEATRTADALEAATPKYKQAMLDADEALSEAEANALLDGAPAPKATDLDAAIQAHGDHTRKIENLRKAAKRMERTLAKERARVFAAAQARIDEIADEGATALADALKIAAPLVSRHLAAVQAQGVLKFGGAGGFNAQTTITMGEMVLDMAGLDPKSWFDGAPDDVKAARGVAAYCASDERVTATSPTHIDDPTLRERFQVRFDLARGAHVKPAPPQPYELPGVIVK